MLNDKIILITGGTGSVGTALSEYILKNYSPKILRILSRDETKQHIFRNKFKAYQKNFRLFIGDIRDKERITRALNDVDIVFHLAALKHVLASEYNPFEAIKTNVLGLQNLIEASIDCNVEKFIFTSTDKAATPCNTMGVTKLLGEKLISAANYYKGKTRTIFYSVRFGNILGSRGSLIPSIKKQIKNDLPIELTHRDMTRYIMGLDSALKLIMNTLIIAQGGEVFVLKMKMVRIIDLIEVLINHYAKLFNKHPSNIKINDLGIYEGEKLYEELFSIEESERTYEIDDMYIIIPQLIEVANRLILENYPNIKKFDKNIPINTQNGPFLTKDEIKSFLIHNKII